MRIVFLLPGRSPNPAGGFKVVYEYANRLAARGHRVSVVHPWSCDVPSSPRSRLAARLWAGRPGRRHDWIVPWFEVHDRVSLPLVAHPGTGELPPADAIVATAWQTAAWVAAATQAREARGFYLIQGYETWDSVEAVRASWRLPLHKIVISGWLEEMATEMGEGARTSRVPNGVDLDSFGIDVPPEQRSLRIGALLSPHKGEEAITAFSIARERIPDLDAVAFGAAARPPALPDWVEYVQLPGVATLRALYNSCSIFLQASHAEGWGLPATEAMTCGCALVTYDNGGSREYAVDRQTAVVVAEMAPEGLADAIVELDADRELRLSLARRGHERVEAFAWPESVLAMEAVLAGDRTLKQASP
jgi:glycosyltransferase involved in cell wall biosynthesis